MKYTMEMIVKRAAAKRDVASNMQIDVENLLRHTFVLGNLIS